MFYVCGPMKLHSDHVGVKYYNYGTGQGGINVGGGAKKSRDHTHVIAEQNEERQGAYKGKQVATLFTGNSHHELLNPGNQNLEKVLASLGNEFYAADRQLDHNHQNDDEQPSIGHIG